MEALTEKITELIAPLFSELGIKLVDLKLRGQTNSYVLSVYADTENGITLDQITDLTRQIEDILDMHDPIRGRYRLEVSSPGTDWPLKEKWQYKKNLNRDLAVTCMDNNNKTEITGKLIKIFEDKIMLQSKKEEHVILFNDILKAEVKLKW